MDAIEYLHGTHDLALECIGELKFDKEHAWHRNVMALYASLIEYCGALCAANKANTYIAIKPIFRSFLEAYVEFKNLVAEKSYGNSMELSYHEQWLKVLKSAKSGNPYLKSIAEHGDIDSQIEDHKNEIALLKENGYRSFNIFDKFKTADMEEEYRSLYNFMSNDTHSNIRALIDRHIEIDHVERTFELVIYKHWSDSEFSIYHENAASLLIDASINVRLMLECGSDKKFRELSEKFNLTKGSI